MMNKRGFLLRDWVVSLLVFSGVVGMFGLMVIGMGGEYGNTNITDPDFDETYNTLSDEVESVQIMRDKVDSGEGLSLIGVADVVFSGAFTVFGQIFGGLALLDNKMESFAEEFGGVPKEVTNIFLNVALFVILTLIIFGVISSVSRNKI